MKGMKKPFLLIGSSGSMAELVAVEFNNARIPKEAMEKLTFIAEENGKKLALTPDGNFVIVEGDRCLGTVSGKEVFRMVMEFFKRR